MLKKGEMYSLFPCCQQEGIVLLFVFALIQVTLQVTSLQKEVNNSSIYFLELLKNYMS